MVCEYLQLKKRENISPQIHSTLHLAHPRQNLKALQGIEGISPRVQVATYESLQAPGRLGRFAFVVWGDETTYLGANSESQKPMVIYMCLH